jgi:hypothetical protein
MVTTTCNRRIRHIPSRSPLMAMSTVSNVRSVRGQAMARGWPSTSGRAATHEGLPRERPTVFRRFDASQRAGAESDLRQVGRALAWVALMAITIVFCTGAPGACSERRRCSTSDYTTCLPLRTCRRRGPRTREFPGAFVQPSMTALHVLASTAPSRRTEEENDETRANARRCGLGYVDESGASRLLRSSGIRGAALLLTDADVVLPTNSYGKESL